MRQRGKEGNTGRRNEIEKKRFMVGLVQLKHVGPASCVSFGSALSSALSCLWRISHPDIRRACRLNASTAAVEDVTARTVVVRPLRSHHKFLKNRTMTLKILLASLLIAVTTSSVLSSSEDHHRVPSRSHRIDQFVWPVWYRDRLPHARHNRPDDERVVRETTTTTRSPWTPRPQVLTTRSPQQINSASRHTEQRMLEQKFNGAVAMAETDGTRAIAYAGYHGNHRHQPKEMGTQSFQPITTTVPTYTRHHSG